MDTTTLFIIGVAVYLYLKGKAPVAPAPTAPVSGAVSTPGAFSFTLPGILSYQNIYGRGTQVSLNPDYFSSLFGGDVQPAQPGPALDVAQQYDYDVTFG